MTNIQIDDLYQLVSKLVLTSSKNQEDVKQVLKKIDLLNESINKSNSCPELRRFWLPRFEVKDFFQYGDTQFSFITNQYNITTSEMGKRKFYSTASLLEVLNQNVK